MGRPHSRAQPLFKQDEHDLLTTRKHPFYSRNVTMNFFRKTQFARKCKPCSTLLVSRVNSSERASVTAKSSSAIHPNSTYSASSQRASVPPKWLPVARTIGIAFVDFIIVAGVIVILRRSWEKNAGIPPLERLAIAALPVFLIIMGLVMIESDQPDAFIAALGVVVGILTLLLMARQITLGQNLEVIARHQTAILDRQDSVLRARAHLVVWGDVERQRQLSDGFQTSYLGFGVMNIGSRAAQSATLQLLMPDSFDAAAMFGETAYPIWFRTPDGEGLSRWETDLSRLFFVDVPVVRAAFVAFNHPHLEANVLSRIKWRIAFADGIVPGKGQWQELTTRASLSGDVVHPDASR